MVACRKPRAWNIGAGSEVTSSALNGTCDKMPPIGANVGGVLRLAPFGVPVVPLVKMMIDECLPAFGAGALLLGGDQVWPSVSSALPELLSVRSGAQCAQLAQRRFGLADASGVFVVVNDELGAFTFRDLFDLRAGERAVEQDDASPDPCAAEFCDREPAVVARQDRDPIAAAHPLGQQPVGDRVRGLVELPVGEFDLRRRCIAARWGVRLALNDGSMPISPHFAMSVAIAA